MNRRMDEWNFSPFYRTSTPIGAAAQKLDPFSWAWARANWRGMGSCSAGASFEGMGKGQGYGMVDGQG